MKAALVEAYGDPDQIRVREVRTLAPSCGELLVQVEAASVNYSDILKRKGAYLGGPLPPFLGGTEGAGLVLEAAEDSSFEGGQRVMFLTDAGAQAELVSVAPSGCVLLPQAMSSVEGAGFLVPFLTAFHCLCTAGKAKAGEIVLVHASGGATGAALVQVAVLLGLRVLAVASTEEKREQALMLGAEEACNYSEVASRAAHMSERRGVDLLVDSVGGDALRTGMRALSHFGRAVVIGNTCGEVQRVDMTRLIFCNQRLCGFHLEDFLQGEGQMRSALQRLFSWREAGSLAPPAAHVFPLSEVNQAHRLMESRDRLGRVILTP